MMGKRTAARRVGRIDRARVVRGFVCFAISGGLLTFVPEVVEPFPLLQQFRDRDRVGLSLADWMASA